MSEKQEETNKKTRIGRIDERGRLTLPAGIRTKYRLKEGDVVSITETSEGILISPQAVIAQRLLERMQEIAGDISLEEWMESGQAIRKELAKEMYGIDESDKTN
ncbi:MAG: AbrB/MazE/SpoVT family DNA-binding domain-containing protein [Ktedonobacterales bacterium]